LDVSVCSYSCGPLSRTAGRVYPLSTSSAFFSWSSQCTKRKSERKRRDWKGREGGGKEEKEKGGSVFVFLFNLGCYFKIFHFFYSQHRL
jgi:ribosomal protein L24E